MKNDWKFTIKSMKTMLINIIKNDPILKDYVISECCENNVSISLSPDINIENYVILKIDAFYNALEIELKPPSIDCLIIVKCSDNTYAIYLIELKSTSSANRLTIENILLKYDTCLKDFMMVRFKDYFNRDYKRIKLYLISNIDIYRRNRVLKLEILIKHKFWWKGKKIMVDPRMPIPQIKNC